MLLLKKLRLLKPELLKLLLRTPDLLQDAEHLSLVGSKTTDQAITARVVDVDARIFLHLVLPLLAGFCCVCIRGNCGRGGGVMRGGGRRRRRCISARRWGVLKGKNLVAFAHPDGVNYRYKFTWGPGDELLGTSPPSAAPPPSLLLFFLFRLLLIISISRICSWRISSLESEGSTRVRSEFRKKTTSANSKFLFTWYEVFPNFCQRIRDPCMRLRRRRESRDLHVQVVVEMGELRVVGIAKLLFLEIRKRCWNFYRRHL